MPRYRLTIAYEGTRFHGWQRQFTTRAHGLPNDIPILGELPDGRVELRTVQGVVRRAVREAVNQDVEVQGASRTDSGVHAMAQCGAFTVEGEGRRPPDATLSRAINAKLPDDVLVTEIVRTEDTFRPISDCVSKGYRYSIHAGPERPLWDRRFVWWTYETLDPALMHHGAQHMVGEHDFASFAAAHHGRESTVRTVFACDVRRREGTDTPIIDIDVSGNGFLYNMVRIIAGTLMEVGRGRFESGEVSRIIEARDRAAAGPTLGPSGLCLRWIEYPGVVVGEGPAAPRPGGPEG